MDRKFLGISNFDRHPLSGEILFLIKTHGKVTLLVVNICNSANVVFQWKDEYAHTAKTDTFMRFI